MDFDSFSSWIQAIRKLHTNTTELYRLGVDLEGINELVHAAQKPLIKFIFNTIQIEVLEWWLYDCPDGISESLKVEWTVITTLDGEQILLNTEQKLYDYLRTLEEAR